MTATIGHREDHADRHQPGGPDELILPQYVKAGPTVRPYAWYDATVGVTASSGAVSQWDDQSGNGRHVTQSTAGNKPTTGTRTQNGRNVIAFDGNDFLDSALFTRGIPFTVFFVAKLEGQPSSGYPNAYGFGSGGPNLYTAPPAPGSAWIAGASTAISYGTADSSVHVHSNVWNSTASSAWIDGILQASGDTGSAGLANEKITVGGWLSDSTAGWVGPIAEVIIYDRVLTDAERKATEAYLAAKWGVADHNSLRNLTVGDPHTQYTRKDTLTTKGDLYVATGAGAPARLGVGANDDVVVADSAQASGLKWAKIAQAMLASGYRLTYAGTTAPASPSSGDMWFDTTNKLVKIYNGSVWITLTPQNAVVATAEGTTTSASWVDLATAGPAVTLDTGTAVIVTVNALQSNSTTTTGGRMGVAVSGASTIGAVDATGFRGIGTDQRTHSSTVKITGLTPGSNTFTAKYHIVGAAGTATFADRNITVTAIPT